MKFLTLALVPLIIFSFAYVLDASCNWAVSRRTSFAWAAYMALNVTTGVFGLVAIVICVIYPFVSK